MKRTISIYTLLLVIFGLVISFVLQFGQRTLQPITTSGVTVATTTVNSTQTTQSPALLSALLDNMAAPLGRLLLQFFVILIATRMLGSVFRRFGQPAVMGEMTAGILLGPSLFGWLAPAASSFIFQTDSLRTLQLLSQVGVCLFMFVVGLELDVSHVRRNAQVAFVVSHASILFPYLLGVLIALSLYQNYAGSGIGFVPFALFMGIAMSITAFPVLVRILQERGMIKTSIGTTAIACAATDDASAWAILACIIAIARARGVAASAFNLGLVVLFVGLMVFVVRRRLPRLLKLDQLGDGANPGNVIAMALIFMTASALITETIGIHSLFGAFLAGLVMPRNRQFLDYIVVRLENVSRLFLLPLFFAFSGLRTHLGLLSDMASWLMCLAIIGVAMAGKIGGTMFSARLMQMKWIDSFTLGALMNTRGLVELVALNIGYDLGILSPTIFTMMVLMALVTTLSTGPLLSLAEYLKRRAVVPVAAVPLTSH